MAKHPAHKCRYRPPLFRPVTLRGRRGGWSVARQCGFLAQLYLTGSVTAAAHGVGMTRASAYRLRERTGAESFAYAWDRVLMTPGSGRSRAPKVDFRKVTHEALIRRVETGLVQPVIYRGRMAGIRRKADISGLLRLVRRGDALHAKGREQGPDR